jgi:hypothetical protein
MPGSEEDPDGCGGVGDVHPAITTVISTRETKKSEYIFIVKIITADHNKIGGDYLTVACKSFVLN